MSLKDQIAQATKNAQRERDAARVSTLRMLQAAIQQLEIDARKPLDDDAVLAVIEKQVKQLRESSAIYEKAGHADKAASDQAEIEVLMAFMPEQADGAEIDAEIDKVLASLAEQGVEGAPAMGRAMGVLKKAFAGRADMGEISRRVKERLG